MFKDYFVDLLCRILNTLIFILTGLLECTFFTSSTRQVGIVFWIVCNVGLFLSHSNIDYPCKKKYTDMDLMT